MDPKLYSNMSNSNNSDQRVGGPAKLVNETPELYDEITMTSADPGSSRTPYVVSDEDQQRDLDLMRDHGFIIEWSKRGEIGSGASSKCVYFGIYGRNIFKNHDKYGQNLAGVKPGDGFAAKYMVTGNRFDKIVAHENEKQVMRDLSHRNIVRFRMAINLGRKKPIDRLDGRHVFDTYSRMFLIMDYADQGNLREFREKPKFNGRMFHTLLSDLCHGLQYLHNSWVHHGDIHQGNALVFSDIDHKTLRHGKFHRKHHGQYRYNLVAKWADFGQSASLDTVPGRALTAQQFEDMRLRDLKGLKIMFENIMEFMDRKYYNDIRVLNIDLWDQVIQSLATNTTMNDIVDKHLNQALPFDYDSDYNTSDEFADNETDSDS